MGVVRPYTSIFATNMPNIHLMCVQLYCQALSNTIDSTTQCKYVLNNCMDNGNNGGFLNRLIRLRKIIFALQ